jgi:ADP-ribose pyrophosphatase
VFERTIRSKKIFKGRIISLRVDDVKLSNGVLSKREIVEHPGAVAVIALTNDNKIILIKQFRKSAEQVMIEIPAGLVHKGERDIDGAKRELLEETGYKAGKIKKVFAGFSSPGFCTEVISFYLATGLTKAKQNCDVDEMIDVYFYKLKDALKLVKSGKVKDNKSIAGILYANLCKK